MTGLKPDGGPECTGIFRSRPTFDVDNAAGGFFPVLIFPLGGSDLLLLDFEATGIKRSSGAVVFQLQLMYRADLSKKRQIAWNSIQFATAKPPQQPPSGYHYVFRRVPVYFRRRPLRCIGRDLK
jgi:hypothetical protein